MNLIELDFERAKARHLLFKTRLRSILYGASLDEETVISPTKCLMGKWIYSHALVVYDYIPEIRELERVHVKIHQYAGELISLYKIGREQEAKDGLQTIEVMASELLRLLAVIEKKVVSAEPNYQQKGDIEELRINYSELRDLNSMLQDLDRRIKEHMEATSVVRKKAVENEEKFRSVVKQAPVGIAILRGPDMIVEMANITYLQIVDRAEEGFVGNSLYSSLPEIKAAVDPILSSVFNTGIPYHGNEFEVTLRRFGRQEQCFFNFVYQPLQEANGDITGVVVVATEVTAQVNAKQTIQQSEVQFRNLVTQSQFAKAIFKGEDMVISVANEALLKIWRRKIEEVEGRKLLDIFPELKNQRFPEILKDVFTTGEIYRENEALAFIDGPGGTRAHYLDFQYAPMFEADGSISGIMVSVNDVTDKVQFRKEISDAVERLSLATEGTRLATWDLNLITSDIIYSPRLAQIYGYEEHVMLTHDQLRKRMHPDDLRSIIEPAFAKAMETGTYFYEARLVHPDESIHWVRTQGKVYYNHEQKPVRMLGTLMDITEQKQSDLALRTSEGKFRTLADSMPQLVWTGDANGNLNYFNQSVRTFSGLSPEQIEQDGCLSLVHPADAELSRRRWNVALKTGTDFLVEHRFRKSDGAYRWHLSHAIPQKDTDGVITMWVGTSTDIHDSKLFIDGLESKVAQRTQELTLINDELVRTNMELAQFAYVASHDLQEPLRKIQTFASRILETEVNLSERGRDYFGRMQASSTRMQQLITDLLAFSRANAVEKHFEKADLNVVLGSVKEQLNDTIQMKNAVIVSDNLPVMNIIVYQFEQLFTNLIANSLKFVKSGTTPVITITSGTISGREIPELENGDNRPFWFISFSDNGIGFEEQFKDRIFQVFQRLHTRNAYDGTGIGLAICKKIVENHHGIITAAGRPNEGATFTCYFPVADRQS
ncbi:Adaptive-response sensory-kinase SasA [Dyadobacter sp. CECT 9275]|uniref:histidine kinase n=1 Tax=Dyadobacter helix TaxID=2822344 RepID=A0A916J9M5_9BACT|nr:PAS domain-containing protein [Dyadobacter sp. CECT 9275]CAG4992988.1 Adaptive-response sensory-kinase SasA [Dyadobacter sp. CECT 9275]